MRRLALPNQTAARKLHARRVIPPLICATGARKLTRELAITNFHSSVVRWVMLVPLTTVPIGLLVHPVLWGVASGALRFINAFRLIPGPARCLPIALPMTNANEPSLNS